MEKISENLNNMDTNKLVRRDFLKFGLISSLIALSGCSKSKGKSVLRGFPNTFPSEFIDTLSKDWEFYPIKANELRSFSINSNFQEKTDLLVLNDGWISNLSLDSFREIKATKIRNNLNNQAKLFLSGLKEINNKKIIPLFVSPWVILFRNENSLSLENKNSWEVLFSSSLTNQIVFPNSPYLIMSIAQKIGLINELSRIKSQAKAYDGKNALNWVVSGRASAAVLPLSSCIDSLIKDPRLSFLLPEQGSPLNWTVLASPSASTETFPADCFDLLWGSTYFKKVVRKGFLPPINLSDLRKKNINFSQRYQSTFPPENSVWDKCWSLPILSDKEKKELALNWNKS